MSRFEIDLATSIKAEKLIYVKWFSERLSRSHDWVIILLIPFFGIAVLWSYIKEGTPLLLPIFLFLLAIIPSVLLVYSMIYGRNLKRISGKSPKENLKIVREIAQKNNWIFHKVNNQLVFVGMPLVGMAWDWGKEMVVILDGNDLLVNVISLDAFGTSSPIHWFANKKKLDAFQEEFLTLLA
ncbi:MAG: hypothetical protein KTR22_10185 [Flavobacteriaceae bacterium]|nr:hypothetical protein [Flavobacteriaceae bacterium]